MKSFQKKIPPYIMGQNTLVPLQNHVGVDAPSIFARKCRLKLIRFVSIGQWLYALYKNWNAVSQNTLGHSIKTYNLLINPFLSLSFKYQ